MGIAGYLKWRQGFVEPKLWFRIGAITAGVIWVAAAAAGLRTGITWKQERQNLAFRREQAEQLAHLRMMVQRWQDAVEHVQRRHASPPRPAVWEKTSLVSEDALTSVKEERVKILPGWQVHRLRCEGNEVPLAALSDFLGLAESASPPWRLVGLTLEANDERGGRGRVSLEMETLEKEVP